MTNARLKELTKSISVKHAIFIIPFWLIIFNFILSASFRCPFLRLFLSNYWLASLLLFLVACLLLFVFVAPYFSRKEANLNYSLIILSPIVLLSLWPAQEANLTIFIPFLIVIANQIIFYKTLFPGGNPPTDNRPRKEKIVLSIIIILYFSIFSYLSIRKINALEFFNPKDFGLFNQIFWNTIHGKFFLNSTYGSHFACHNSLFYLLLLPFYYLFPSLLTLSILKTLLLSLSAIPFYLIIRANLKQASAFVMVIAFLFFPFIVGQNFTPAHEEGFAPFFILFAFYFFRKNKFMPFLFFLLVTISIKESLAPIAVMFGCYAFLKKRSLAWIIYPILIGIAWTVLSIALINHFQNLYQPHSDSAWFFVYLKNAFLTKNQNGPLPLISYLLFNSNMLHWEALKSMFVLILPLGIVLPLLSSVSLLGFPELILNLLSSNRRIFSPIWHYNIALSCFILIGAVEGIRKISAFAYNKGFLQISEQKLQSLLCISILSCTLIYSHVWIGLGIYTKDAERINTVKEALSLVPSYASISAPADIAAIVSGREKYSILGSDSEEDYILIDNQAMEKDLKTNIDSDYNEIFRRGHIILYERKNKGGVLLRRWRGQ